jgi:hypothetical protein
MHRTWIGTLALAALAAGATAQTIADVSAVTNDPAHPVTVRLGAGAWRVTPIDQATGGAFSAWHPWAGVNSGCGPTAGSCSRGWMWSCFLACPGAPTVHLRRVLPVIGVPKFASAAEAFAGGAAPLWLQLDRELDIGLWIGDSTHQDNLGGVSLRFERVAAGPPALGADTPSISMRSGGAQRLTLDAGPGRAGQQYLLLGSTSGTNPGLPFGHWVLPLNAPDPYLEFTISAPNTAIHVATLGVLDPQGRAFPRLELPGPQAPALTGLVLHHAAVLVEGGTISGISAPVRVEFVR